MHISKQLVVAAGVAFLALFGAVFFLLGRESGHRRGAPPAPVVAPMAAADTWGNAAPPPAVVVAPPAAAVVAVVPAMPATAPAMPVTAAAPAPTSPSLPPLQLGADRPVPSSGNDNASAVRDYFTRMQAIQTVGPTADTGEFANKLLASSMNGDTSGLDELVRVAEEGARRAAAVTPPPELASYHQKMLAMLGESAGMVRQIKTAMTSNDPSALGALAGAGSSLQTRANALEDEARQIKAKYGLH